jgi:hypothetical protein
MTKWLDMGFGIGDLPAQMLGGYEPGGQPRDWWVPRAKITQNELARLAEIGPDWEDLV